MRHTQPHLVTRQLKKYLTIQIINMRHVLKTQPEEKAGNCKTIRLKHELTLLPYCERFDQNN